MLSISGCFRLTHCGYLISGCFSSGSHTVAIYIRLCQAHTLWLSISGCFRLTHCGYLISGCFRLTHCGYLISGCFSSGSHTVAIYIRLFQAHRLWLSISGCFRLTHCGYLISGFFRFTHCGYLIPGCFRLTHCSYLTSGCFMLTHCGYLIPGCFRLTHCSYLIPGCFRLIHLGYIVSMLCMKRAGIIGAGAEPSIYLDTRRWYWVRMFIPISAGRFFAGSIITRSVGASGLIFSVPPCLTGTQVCKTNRPEIIVLRVCYFTQRSKLYNGERFR